MRYILALIGLVWAMGASAQAWEDQRVFGDPGAAERLRIISSTDTALFASVLEGFARSRPGLAIEYYVTATAEIDSRVRRAPQDFDVVISSAMDLQFKLANDGFARRVDGLSHPDWAQWRNSLFAFTSEPAAIVLNRAAFAGREVPRTRQALIRVLRDRAEDFRGRVGTYDVRQSGLGYLFATQDARTSETFWRLMEVMGNLDARLYCCSGAMIEDVASGKIAVAYNVLGSYAKARSDLLDRIEIVLPSDFQTIMMRSALVSRDAPNATQAIAFVSFLLKGRGDPGAAPSTALPMLDRGAGPGGQAIIALEPGLMSYLDRLKSAQFLEEWEDAMIQ